MARRWILACFLFACDEDAIAIRVDAGNDVATMDAALEADVATYTCVVVDAGLPPEYTAADASASCPAQWSDLTHDGGIPNACSVEGVLCIYPEGQAVCRNEGNAGLRWATNASGLAGCPALPPTQCAPCTPFEAGTECQYLTDASANPPTANFCCDGRVHAWNVIPDNRCPNDHVCGTIKASDYDQSCTTAADCRAVTEGDTCTMVCDCFNATVSASAVDQYRADFEAKTVYRLGCPCPSGPVPTCDAGKCSVL
jgi:hypothetical protein